MTTAIKKLTATTETRTTTLPKDKIVDGKKVGKTFWKKTFFDLTITFVYHSGNKITETYTFHKYGQEVRITVRRENSLYVMSRHDGNESLTINEFKSRAAKKFGFHSTKLKKFILEAEYTLLDAKAVKQLLKDPEVQWSESECREAVKSHRILCAK